MSNSLEFMEKHLDIVLSDIDALVKLETYSTDKAALNSAMGFISTLLEQRLGTPDCSVRKDGGELGDALIVTYKGNLDGHVTLIGHYDTVWPQGTLANWDQWESYDEVGRRMLSGPGIFDMKTGLVQGIWALKFLRDHQQPHPTVTFIINGDEELGSLVSRPWIEEQTAQSDAVFVLEASADGKVKVARKGVAIISIEAEGVEAHAGLDPSNGASAVNALMEFCMEAISLADTTKETTLNVGLIEGGSASNVVAGKATAVIDIRYWDPAEQSRLNDGFDAIRWTDPRVKVTTVRDWNRPPMVFTPGSKELFGILANCAQKYGRELEHISVGGASDANFVSAIGVPVICGLGACGSGAHARHEFIYPDEIPFFTAIVADAITEVGVLKSQ